MGLKTHKGNIPVSYAAELGYGPIVDMLLGLEMKKEQVNSQDAAGQTLLMKCVVSKLESSVGLLL